MARTSFGALVALLSLVWFRYAPIPFLGPAVFAGLFCIFAVRATASEWAQSVWVTLATAALSFAAIEAYWSFAAARVPPAVVYPESYLLPNDLLGYVPRPDTAVAVQRRDGDRVIYDVVYTIDSLGLRVSPPPGSPPPTSCVVFFGDSFTFGEGVEDSESMPYQVGMHLARQYHVLNFGLHGYGPHQMLAAFEAGYVTERIDCEPRFLVYQAIPDHVGRVSGRPRGVRGPRYELAADGLPVRSGNHEDVSAEGLTFGAYVLSQFEKSRFLSVLGARTTDSDRELFYSVVARSRDLGKMTFPNAEFHVLLWPDGEDATLLQGLRGRDLSVHPIEEVLPGYVHDPTSLTIPEDGHPSPEAHRQIASYVVTQIVRQ